MPRSAQTKFNKETVALGETGQVYVVLSPPSRRSRGSTETALRVTTIGNVPLVLRHCHSLAGLFLLCSNYSLFGGKAKQRFTPCSTLLYCCYASLSLSYSLFFFRIPTVVSIPRYKPPILARDLNYCPKSSETQLAYFFHRRMKYLFVCRFCGCSSYTLWGHSL